jgi:VIT1/CCC1 family predicted Fe2+/Mn2+ transporter
MKIGHTLKIGLSFGLTSGIITTLGLMVGLHAGTHSKLAVVGGILTIAIADAFSDALGIHVSEESEGQHTVKEIWESTLFTFLFKFVFALTFLVPLFFLELSTAVLVSVIYGLTLLGVFSYYITGNENRPWAVALEHLLIGMVVVVSTHYVGDWIRVVFG